MVVALGADYDIPAVAGATHLRDVLPSFERGHASGMTSVISWLEAIPWRDNRSGSGCAGREDVLVRAAQLVSLAPFQHLLCYAQPCHRAFPYLLFNSSPQHRPGEPAEAVRAAATDRHKPDRSGSARRVGHERAKLERRPEVVAGVQHLRSGQRRRPDLRGPSDG